MVINNANFSLDTIKTLLNGVNTSDYRFTTGSYTGKGVGYSAQIRESNVNFMDKYIMFISKYNEALAIVTSNCFIVLMHRNTNATSLYSMDSTNSGRGYILWSHSDYTINATNSLNELNEKYNYFILAPYYDPSTSPGWSV